MEMIQKIKSGIRNLDFSTYHSMRNIIFGLFLMLSVSSVIAQTSATIDNLNYTLDDVTNEAYLTGRASTTVTAIAIPTSVTYNSKTYPVTKVMAGAFESGSSIDSYYNNITSVTFTSPSNVREIGDKAFFGTNFNQGTLTIPGSVKKIGITAFAWTNMSSVVLEEGVESIGKGAFYDSSPTSITFPVSLRSIGEYAFMWSSLKNIVIPEGVENIGSFAFAFTTNNPSIILPSTLKHFGNCVFFYDPLLKNITVADGCQILSMGDAGGNDEGVLFNKDKTRLIYFSALQDLSLRHYQYKVPANVTEIGGGAFSGAGDAMKSIVLPTDLALIDSFAFIMNPLKNITIPAKAVLKVGSIPSDCKEIFMMGNQGTDAIKEALKPVIIYPGLGYELSSRYYGGSVNAALYCKQSMINDYANLAGVSIGYGEPSTVTSVSYEIPATTSKVLTTMCRDFDVDLSDATLANGVKAYIATEYGDGAFTDIDNVSRNGAYMKMTPITYIPSRWGSDKHQYTGVVLKSTAGNTFHYKIGENDVYSASPVAAPSSNKLSGAPCYTRVEQTETENGVTYVNYGLNDGKFKKYSQSGILSVNKAYLRLPQGAGAKENFGFFFMDESSTTGIDKVSDTMENGSPYYNLNGQRVENAQHGVFIRNGKKILIK
jgi:hypothetical protein